MVEPVYLGDGLYASYNGYHLMLKTVGEDQENVIFLEPEVFDNLMEFAKRVDFRSKYTQKEA